MTGRHVLPCPADAAANDGEMAGGRGGSGASAYPVSPAARTEHLAAYALVRQSLSVIVVLQCAQKILPIWTVIVDRARAAEAPRWSFMYSSHRNGVVAESRASCAWTGLTRSWVVNVGRPGSRVRRRTRTAAARNRWARRCVSEAHRMRFPKSIGRRASRAHRDGPGPSRCGLSAFLYAGGRGRWPGRY